MLRSVMRQDLERVAGYSSPDLQCKLIKDQRGSALPIMVAIILLGSMGGALAVDLARAYSTRNQLLLAAESAALAAAASLPNVEQARKVAIHYMAKNLHEFGEIVGKDDIEFGRWDSVNRSVASDGKSVNTVRVTARLAKGDGAGLTTLFAGIVGEQMINVAASATAGKFGVACLIALNPDGKGLKLDKDAQLELEGCGAQSNATSKESLNVKGDSELSAAGICASGGVKVADPSAVSPVPTEYCPSIADPMVGFEPPEVGGCTYSKAEYKNEKATISPGIYCGGLKLEGASEIEMEPGLYIIDNGKLDLKGEAKLTGENVTIMLHGKKAEFDIGGSARMRLAAPQEGPRKGLLIVQDQGDLKKENKWDSDQQSDLTGVVYLPDGKFKSEIESNITASEACFVLLASEIVLSGKAKMSIDLTGESCQDSLPAALSGRVVLLE